MPRLQQQDSDSFSQAQATKRNLTQIPVHVANIAGLPSSACDEESLGTCYTLLHTEAFYHTDLQLMNQCHAQFHIDDEPLDD